MHISTIESDAMSYFEFNKIMSLSVEYLKSIGPQLEDVQ